MSLVAPKAKCAAGSAATPSEIAASVNASVRARGGIFASYSATAISWDDVERGTVDGQLSCVGSNITDVQLRTKKGDTLYTLRADNW